MTDVTSERGQAMQSYLPPFYKDSELWRQLTQSKGEEFDQLSATIENIFNQLFIRMATWSLDKWEDEFGIPRNPSLTSDERISRILAKSKGYGNVNTLLMKTVAESFKNGQIDVVQNFPLNEVLIRFIDTKGRPSNLSDLQAALEEIVPAHLGITYQLLYTIWSEVDGHTWAQINGTTWQTLSVTAPI